jgi:hypothetical protein
MHDRYEIHIRVTAKDSVEWIILVGDYGSEDYGDSAIVKGKSESMTEALQDVAAWLKAVDNH